jgi:hypothetical protein
MQSVDVRQPLSIMAVFSRDYTDEDMEVATSGLTERGFNRLRLLTSRPPKLMVTLGDDASQDQIEEVSNFLSDIEHVEVVRVTYPSTYRSS